MYAHPFEYYTNFTLPEVIFRAVARALIGGGGGGGVYSYIPVLVARLISFEINLKTTDFKRNSWGITRIYEYTPLPPINTLATTLGILPENLRVAGKHCRRVGHEGETD